MPKVADDQERDPKEISWTKPWEQSQKLYHIIRLMQNGANCWRVSNEYLWQEMLSWLVKWPVPSSYLVQTFGAECKICSNSPVEPCYIQNCPRGGKRAIAEDEEASMARNGDVGGSFA
ncbi:hypothetical protein JRQ81_017014 [Phrynocephalus forsythii]|uniref:Uncharacterized protein n=1 Tax=Phrynocephalus forsythii TaxID=171643 RepID=A0A9Q0XVX2_9SAUR|nr:hypothetical protein JRQ81_017014 [Phrynocephalus forsythii]